MPTYFDPMTLDDLDITPSTTLYLICVSEDSQHPEKNTYAIKGLSSGLHQIPHDPHTYATQYWLINTTVLLANQDHEPANAKIFPENKLTTESLALSIIKLYLKLDPTRIEATRFNKPRANQPQQEANRQRERDLFFAFFSGTQYPHRPAPHDGRENRNVRLTNSGTLKILALFLLIPGLSHFIEGHLEVSVALLIGAILAYSSTCFMQPNWTETVAGLR